MKRIITIGREFGSGGREFGRRIAEKLQIAYFDQEIITEIAKRTAMSEEYVRQIEEMRPTMSFPIQIGHSFYMTSDAMFHPDLSIYTKQHDLLRELAMKSDCVIVGRCADYVLSEYSPCRRVFLHAPLEERVKRAVEEYGVSSRNPQFTVIRKDKDRSSYYNYFTDKKWGKVQNYDIALSTSIGLEECADIIVKYVKTVIGKEE